MAEPPLEDTPTSWPVLESEDLFRDDWVMALRRDMIRPPDGVCAFITRKAAWVQRKTPVRLVSTTLRHWS